MEAHAMNSITQNHQDEELRIAIDRAKAALEEVLPSAERRELCA